MPTDKNYIMAWEMAAEKEINVPEFLNIVMKLMYVRRVEKMVL